MSAGRPQRFYVKAGRLIDGTGARPLEHPVVAVENGRIDAIDSAPDFVPPEGAEAIDLGPATLLPGLIDCHVHLNKWNCNSFRNERVARFETTPALQQLYALFHAQQCLAMGFTTLRDMGMMSTNGLMTEEMCAVRDAIAAGIFEGPRLLVAGWAVITGSHLDLIFPRAAKRAPGVTADGPWALRAKVREHMRTGCDLIKTCVSGGAATIGGESPKIRNMTAEETAAIVDEAHAFGLNVAAHCFTPDGQRMCLDAGIDTIEHCVFTDDDAIVRLRDARTPVVPTLAHRCDHAIAMKRQLGAAEGTLRGMKSIQDEAFETFRRMLDAGIPLAMGTDMGEDPEAGRNALELQLYVEQGMSPMAALQSATGAAARALGLERELGTVEAGKVADMVAVDGDPLADIQILQERPRILMVMRGGRVMIDRRAGHRREICPVEPGDWVKLA